MERVEQLLRALNAPSPADDAVAEALERVFAEARRSWPLDWLDDQSFISAIAGQLDSEGDLSLQLDGLHASDLYLATAALAGRGRALERFDAYCFAELPAYLSSIDPNRDHAQEAIQRLRDKLLCATAERPAKLGQYSGRGGLKAFVRIAAVRELFSLKRSDRREAFRGDQPLMSDEALLDFAAESAVESELLRGQLRDLFKQAFHQALATLSARQRNLLRYQLLQGVSLEQIGRAYGAHRVTVARWFAEARNALRIRTRTLMRERLQQHEDVDELLPLVDSQLELSLSRVLGPDASMETRG